LIEGSLRSKAIASIATYDKKLARARLWSFDLDAAIARKRFPYIRNPQFALPPDSEIKIEIRSPQCGPPPGPVTLVFPTCSILDL